MATVIKLPVARRFKVANNEIIESNLVASFEIDIKGYFPTINAYIMEELAAELIVGANFMPRWKIKLDLEREEFIIDEK